MLPPRGDYTAGMRLFWAIGISDGVRESARAVQQQLRDPALRWSRLENLHVTLKFLGETELAVEGLLAAARPACAEVGPLELSVGEVGSFGRPPRVVWLGLEGPGRSRLCLLAAALDEACHRLGFPRETRAFAPHLTLARVRRGQRIRRPQGVEVPPARFTADAIGLWQSRPGQGYRELARVTL